MQTISLPDDRTISFLGFANHWFAPDSVTDADGKPIAFTRGETELIAPFQQLYKAPFRFDAPAGSKLCMHKSVTRDAFWDQVIPISPELLGERPGCSVVETGKFGAALTGFRPRTPRELSDEQANLADPIIAAGLDRELPWNDLAAAALPLDFQKVLIASFDDSNPAFAFENGQWLTTWLSRDLPRWNKEDHWFAPALLIGDELIRPAPLSSQAAFVTLENGVTVPMFTIEWKHAGMSVRQTLFSLPIPESAQPRTFARFQLQGAPAGAKLAIGLGRRPNVHWWDEKSRPRTPLPFFSTRPEYHADGNRVIDANGLVILATAEPMKLQSLGPVEMIAIVEPDADGSVHVITPQSEMSDASIAALEFNRAERAFKDTWSRRLADGATVELPSQEWQRRVDIWRSQVESITRVVYQKKERLSYGAYFYQYYFGIEEGWPVVALAQWGRGSEAQRQARIMLEAENLDKTNVHHQSRNGAAAWCAAEVARLTRDPAFLQSVAPALLECANWTIRVTSENQEGRSELTRGLLPPHIYGGDVRDAATSLYATAACWRGMESTADVFLLLGDETLKNEGERLRREADALRSRIDRTMHAVLDRSTTPPFPPFALELPSLDGKNEGPHDRITATRFGNYWNLFAPSFLELHYRCGQNACNADEMVFNFAQQHGGVWAGLPRFYNGLDAAYAIGNIDYLLGRSAVDWRYRAQALASLESFFLHAASRNGYTIPEVAGLFPYRLEPAAYERIVRESPWQFGMYDAHRYLEGHLFCTEPLGAAAGEALTMIRNALLCETRDSRGNSDGGLLVLPAVPADWYAEGKQIVLRDFPTRLGNFSATIRSSIDSRREIVMEHKLQLFEGATPVRGTCKVRLAPAGRDPIDIEFDPLDPTPVRARF